MKAWLWLAACALAAAPAAAQVPGEQDLQIADVETLQRAVDELRGEMFRRGPRVEGWDVGGVDPDAELRERGADRFYFLNRDSGGTSVGPQPGNRYEPSSAVSVSTSICARIRCRCRSASAS